MNTKPGKSPEQGSKTSDKSPDSDHRSDQKPSGKPLRPAGEGSNNLRQRAEWFSKREGGDK
jgi:hypothetical protein